jgi:hypothetical protein
VPVFENEGEIAKITDDRTLSTLLLNMNKSIILVPVPPNFGSGPTLLAPLGSVSLVPPILTPSDRGGWTVSKNANHRKTCT